MWNQPCFVTAVTTQTRHHGYLVHLGLGGLLQRVQDDVQVLLELPPDGQSNVSEGREDLRLNGAMDILILENRGEGGG